MKMHLTKAKRLPGTGYEEIYKKAFTFYLQIKRRTKRRPYIRSAYFGKGKIFLGLFWQHMHQKNWRDRVRRARYFVSAIELIQFSRIQPTIKENLTKNEVLYRFAGITPDGEIFYVQIKEDKKSGEKWLMSVFPEEK